MRGGNTTPSEIFCSKDVGDEYGLEEGSVLIEEVNLVPAVPSSHICSATGQSHSAHDVLSKRGMEDAVRLVGSAMAPGAHGHIFLLKPSVLLLEQEPVFVREGVR